MNLISLLIALIIAGLLFYLIVWLIGWIGLPEPFGKLVKVVVGLIVVLYLLSLLGWYALMPHFRW